jgi:hypothetical protein
MVDDRLRLARALSETAELREELVRLSEERLRLARRNERLTGLLHELRADPSSSEQVQVRIDDALDYDGRETLLLYEQPDEQERTEDEL